MASCQATDAYAGAPWSTQRGGARASCTRSTRAPSRTRTATGSVTPRSFADSNGDGVAICAADRPPGPPRVAGRRRHLAESDDALAQRRLGLRRRRLLRRAPRPRHARGPRRARGRGGRARHPRAARPRPQPHELRARLVRRRARAGATPSSATTTSGPTRRPDGGPPNNWESNFGGSAWQWHEPTGQYYLNNFLPTQPDLNWWNEDVRGAFDDVLRFWFDRGIAGFRIDVCHAIVKDRELRDDPAVTPDDHPEVRRRAVRQVFSMNRPGGPRRAAPLAADRRRGRPARDPRRGDLRARPRRPDALLRRRRGRAEPGLQLPLRARRPRRGRAAHDRRGGGGEAAAGRLARLHGLQPRRGPLHDALGGDDPRRSRLALLMLLTLRGTPFLYYGDELGLPEVRDGLADGARPGRAAHGRPLAEPRPLPHADALDARARRRVHDRGRRTPWLPFGDLAAHNVADQAADRGPHAAPHARPDRAAPGGGGAADGRLRGARGAGGRLGVAPRRRVRRRRSTSPDAPVEIAGIDGAVAIGTDRGRDGEAVGGALALGPWEAALVRMG